MRNDTSKLCIALCGPLPGVAEKLDSRDDVEYTVFPNGSALYERIEDDAPFDFMVVRSDAGAGLVPLYYPGCDGDCFVFLTADTQDIISHFGNPPVSKRGFVKGTLFSQQRIVLHLCEEQSVSGHADRAVRAGGSGNGAAGKSRKPQNPHHLVLRTGLRALCV